MSKIKLFSLGGLDENGKNIYCVEIDKDIFIFDCGLKYASGNMLGIDYIITVSQIPQYIVAQILKIQLLLSEEKHNIDNILHSRDCQMLNPFCLLLPEPHI